LIIFINATENVNPLLVEIAGAVAAPALVKFWKNFPFILAYVVYFAGVICPYTTCDYKRIIVQPAGRMLSSGMIHRLLLHIFEPVFKIDLVALIFGLVDVIDVLHTTNQKEPTNWTTNNFKALGGHFFINRFSIDLELFVYFVVSKCVYSL
jgi:hypothetical protein